MSRFKFVTFDVTHTLLQFRSPVGGVYSKAAATFGLHQNLCEETVESAFNRNFKQLLKEHPNFGAYASISSEEWWSMLVEKTLKDSVKNQESLSREILKSMSEHLFQLYSKKDCWSVLPGVTGLLKKLKEKDVKLGVISNFDERLENVLINTRLRPFFNVVLASYSVKTEKPNKEIFDLALEKLENPSLKPHHALHIGDNIKLDYEGAKNAGWNALLLVDPNEKIALKDLNIAYSVVDIERIILKK